MTQDLDEAMSGDGGGVSGVKRYTLLVEMRCNSFCIFCGSRSIDPAVRRVRKKLGLKTPRKVSLPQVQDVVRRGIDTTVNVAQRMMGNDPPPMDAPRTPYGGFDLPGAKRAIERARGDGFEYLSIQGGEPTIWPWLRELITHAREIGFRDVIMVTNGRLLAERAASRRILEAGLTGIVFSLLGPDAEVHDSLAASKGSFDAVVAAMGHAVEYSREHPGTFQTSVNVIVSAESVDRLPDEMELLARLGIQAANLHLVRFALFGNEPTVRARLSFPLSRIQTPLRQAFELAQSRIQVHAADIPPCQHPWLRESEVQGVFARSRSFTRHGKAPYLHYDSKRLLPRRRHPECATCLFDGPCNQAPREYLENDKTALRPITVETLAEAISSDVGDPVSIRRRLEDMRASVVSLHAEKAIDNEALKMLGARLRQAFADLVLRAIERDDGDEALAALYGVLGLRPPREIHAEPGMLARVRATAAQLVADAPNDAPAPNARWVDFAPGLSVALGGGDEAVSGEVRVGKATVAPLSDEVPGGALVYAMFMHDVVSRLRRARALRWTPTNVELDGERGWRVVWTRAAPWAVQLR